MTDNEIIELLERMITDYPNGILAEILLLITCQKAEIERLKDCPKCVYEYDGEISEYCIQGPCTNFTTVEKIKSEAYKEFAERLKCGVPQETGVIRCSDVDDLVKEMVG